MSEPSSHPLADADLIAWTVVLSHRARQQRDGVNILLQPYPPCPTCGEPVHEAKSLTLDRPGSNIQLTVEPCGHLHSSSDDHVRRLWLHLHEMMADVASGYHGYAVGTRAWTTEEIVREAHARAAGTATEGDSYPAPAPNEVQVRPGPRQPAHDAVYAYIRHLGQYLPPDPVHRNAVIWRAVQAALDATPVGRCVSSHCVEGDHIIDAGDR
ncbi:hypothetical protein KVH30_02465 [Streptomyces olivaceus]|uniref:hypothetical protein n=1 Tax=Streptomyces olivaceus TaxID=47716 RepID=UPI001CC9845D|nr:hypothetical protein [Streptomyces olivaceus]MBZ6290437.1 hypothetical protein [Streptomyces olivaceus]MBZ6324389.1 hypothetical protein [Streptomyces olivaceus]